MSDSQMIYTFKGAGPRYFVNQSTCSAGRTGRKTRFVVGTNDRNHPKGITVRINKEMLEKLATLKESDAAKVCRQLLAEEAKVGRVARSRRQQNLEHDYDRCNVFEYG